MKVFMLHKISKYMLKNKYRILSAGKKYNKYFVAIAAMCLFIIFMKDFMFNDYYGPKGWDWEWYSHYWEFMRYMIKDGHFPLFHFYEIPMETGRAYFFANGESPSLSPFAILLFWFSAGKVISIYFFLLSILGIWGLVCLSKYFNWHPISVLFSFATLFLSGNFLAHFYFGHLNWVTLFYFPFIFYHYLKKERYFNFSMTILFLSLTIFDGGQHIFIWYLVFLGIHSLVTALIERRFKPVITTTCIFLCTVMISAVKLVPMYYYHKEHIEEAYVLRGFQNIRSLNENIFSKEFAKTVNKGNIFYRGDPDDKWPLMVRETYSYLGYFPVILTLFSIITNIKSREFYKRYLPIIIAGICFFCFSYDKVWRYISNMSWLGLLRVERHPSRFIIMSILSLALVIPIGLNNIYKYIKKYGYGIVMYYVLICFCAMFIILPLYWNTMAIRDFSKDGDIAKTERYNRFLKIQCGSPFMEDRRQTNYSINGNNLEVSINSENDIYLKFKNFDIGKYCKYLKITPYNKVSIESKDAVIISKGFYKLSFKFYDDKILIGAFISILSLVCISIFLSKQICKYNKPHPIQGYC